ncbi:MAG TPA: hypothetical protein PK440_20940 [Candidatus Accumulibacter phosphatis]|nr:MAG: hypothetical protein AW07_03648 [Candidatus Accumulibacter sp. SK-11]HAY29207.1 hypothetical protein [Accumulibacter sp.]HCN67321.1 hypothetical protein [Accumulibacter sp.]HRQ97425.1 hypothetical protein [Candidatus Accumulibacter phosphatis]
MRHEHAARVFAQRSKRLWIAVVQQAIDDAMGRGSFAPGSPEEIQCVQREALRWIFHDRSSAANSFHSLCDLLDIDPDRARERLRQNPAIRRGIASARCQRSGEGD